MSRESVDVVVIGGGIIGSATAYYLARRGAKVALLDKGEIGFEQSSRAWGFVRQQGRDPSEVPLMIESNKMWQKLEDELEADIEWVQGGNLAIANDEDRLGKLRDWLPVAERFGIDTRIIDRDEIRRLIPGIDGPFIGGMYTPGDGHAEPGKATRAFADAAREHGADVRAHCAVESLTMLDGRVEGVRTERGDIEAPFVVCAAGAHSAKVARMAGLSLPQRVVRATVAETTPVDPITPIGVWAPGVSFRQRKGGTFYLAGGASSVHDITLESFRHLPAFMPNYLKNRKLFRMNLGKPLVDDIRRSLPWSEARQHPFSHTVDVEPWPERRTAVRSIEGFTSLFPGLRDTLKIRRVWAGMIDATPDAVPVMGKVDEVQGLIFATGFSGHGFAFGPIAGHLVTEIILDGEPSLDIHGMRFSRFAEGDIGQPKNVL